ncbi:hypothetical protein Bca4012_078732 [Brassica carinata]
MLKKLSLRQNLIEDSAVEPLSRWDALSDLEVLILRDNKLAEVPDISIFSRLLVFDVSFNEITSLEGLSKASSTLKELYLPPTLTDLDLTVNRLSELDSRIAHLSMLKKLSLRQNLIEDSAVEPLSRWDALSDLEELILRDNKLAEVPDISIFSRLLVFDVSFNEITSLEGLSKASSTLKELYLPPTLTDLDLTVNRLSELDSRIAHLSMLKKLSLRQNLIEDSAVEPFSRWDALSDLEELILRDNKLAEVPDISIFSRLLVFDVSFNEITSLEGLSKASSTLKELYVSKNEVNKIMEIEHLHDLQILELGSNRLWVIVNMESLTKLEELWLGRNRIKVVNLCGLRCIKKISLQSNQLTSMKGFEDCVALEELYLSHNGISKMEGLSALVNLRVLDVSNNKLTSVDDIQSLTKLEDLWLNDN